MSQTDWPSIHRELWRLVAGWDGRLSEATAVFSAELVAALRASGHAIDAAAEERIGAYLGEVDALLRDAISAAIAPVAAAAGAAMADHLTRSAMTDAYMRRWPDGLSLSQRVWRWGDATRAGISDALSKGVELNRATGELVYDLQRKIEALSGKRFAITTQEIDDWASGLADIGRRFLAGQSGWGDWIKMVDATRRHLGTLRDGGTRRQAEAAFDAIKRAVRTGNVEAVDEAIKWWIYDRQLYALRRIARTEMATAHHRAVIATTRENPLILGYKWRLSSSHPEPDICDYYASVELGMGKGVWPKDRVPPSKAHPHCMCSLTPTTYRLRPDGERGTVDLEGLKEQMGAKQRAAFEAELGTLPGVG